MAPCPTTVSTSRVSGPMTEPAPTVVRALQHHPGQQLHLGAERDRGVDVGAGRVDHPHAFPHPVAVDAGPQRRFGLGQLDLVVDPHGLGHLGGLHGDDLVARLAEDGDGVGQVVLALGVLGRQPAQRRGQETPAEAVDRRVDLVDGPLLLGGVPVVDDGLDTGRPCPARCGRSRSGRAAGRSARWRRRRSRRGAGPGRPASRPAAAACRRGRR